MQAIVARSTCPSQKCKKVTGDVQMPKKCTPLLREAHFQVKLRKARHVQNTFGSSDVEKVRAVVARSTFPTQNSNACSDQFWTFTPCHKWATPWSFCSSFNYNHYTTLRCTALHCNALHYTTLHYTTLHYTTLH